MGWFTHVVADEATQGIDPAAQEQSLENFFDRVWPERSDHKAVYLVPVSTDQL